MNLNRFDYSADDGADIPPILRGRSDVDYRGYRYARAMGQHGFAVDAVYAPEMRGRSVPLAAAADAAPKPASPRQELDMSRLANDAAATAVRALHDYRTAEAETRDYVPAGMAFDSAAGLYDAALTRMGIDTSGLGGNAAALRASFRIRRGSPARQASTPAETKARNERFPNWNRLD